MFPMRLHQPVSASRTIIRVEGADRPHCMTCRLLVRLACALSPPASSWTVVQADSCDEKLTLPELPRVRLHRELFDRRTDRRASRKAFATSSRMARKKCLAEKRGTAQSGEILALRSIARATNMPKASSALTIVTAPTPRALLAGRAAGDSPVSPSPHGLHNPSRLLGPPSHAALAFATWVAIASISGGDRQS